MSLPAARPRCPPRSPARSAKCASRKASAWRPVKSSPRSTIRRRAWRSSCGAHRSLPRKRSRSRPKHRAPMLSVSTQRQQDLEKLKLTSASALDAARTQAEASRARASSQKSAVRVAQESFHAAQVQLDNTDRAGAVCGRRDGEGGATRRDDLADLCGWRIHPHRNRHDRRHGFARDPGRRQRGVHQSRTARTSASRPSSTRIRTGAFRPKSLRSSRPPIARRRPSRCGSRSEPRMRESCRRWACESRSWSPSPRPAMRPRRRAACWSPRGDSAGWRQGRRVPAARRACRKARSDARRNAR